MGAIFDWVRSFRIVTTLPKLMPAVDGLPGLATQLIFSTLL
jgi:hypothetical protein